MDTSITLIPGTAENWENGLLGRDPAHAKRAPAELEAAVNKSLGLKEITLLVPNDLLEKYNKLALSRGFSSGTFLMRKALKDFLDAHTG
jgi:hypothetical protein